MKEPRIMQMDWKALGYQSKWENDRLIWEKLTDSESLDSQSGFFTLFSAELIERIYMINVTMHDFILLIFGGFLGFLTLAIALAKDDLIKIYQEHKDEQNNCLSYLRKGMGIAMGNFCT